MNGYIFRCSNATADECFERELFGEVDKLKQIIEQIKPGDVLFLYNVASERLEGEFEAVTNGGKDIVLEAWQGKYPWQVKVKRTKDFDPITRKEIEGVIRFNFRYPQPAIDQQQINSLRSLFSKAEQLPSTEVQFRETFQPEHRADDGHYVRSFGELTIDNWLFHQGICHGYERKLPITEGVYCDFFIPYKNGYVYLELWGREDNKYKERKDIKKAVYKKYEYQLVDIEYKDLDNIDDILPKKLRMYLPDFKFI